MPLVKQNVALQEVEFVREAGAVVAVIGIVSYDIVDNSAPNVVLATIRRPIRVWDELTATQKTQLASLVTRLDTLFTGAVS